MKNKLWKKVLGITLAISMAAGIAGCGKGTNGNNTADNGGDIQGNAEEINREDLKGVKIRFVQQMLNDTKLQETYEQIFAEYKEESGVEVELEIVTGDFRVWVTTQHTAQNAPDVVVTGHGFAKEDYKKGYLIDWNEYLDNPNPYNNDTPLRETLKQSILAECVDPDNGAIPVLSYGVNGVQILYNKTAFEKAGITEVPNTYDEFLKACEQLKASGVTPISLSNPGTENTSLEWWLNIFQSQMDEELRTQMDLNDDGTIEKNEMVAATDKGLIDFTKEPFANSYEFVKSLIPYCNSDFNSTTEDQALDLWLGQKAAMTLGLTTWMKDIVTIEDLGFEYDIMDLPCLTEDNYPTVTGKHPYNGGRLVNGYMVTKSGDPLREAAAIDFVNYMLSPEVVKKLTDRTMLMPSIEGVELDERFEKWIPTEEDQLVSATYFAQSIFKEFKDFNVLSGQLYLSGEMDQEEFLAGLDEEWKRNCEKAKQENGWSEENNYGMDN